MQTPQAPDAAMFLVHHIWILFVLYAFLIAIFTKVVRANKKEFNRKYHCFMCGSWDTFEKSETHVTRSGSGFWAVYLGLDVQSKAYTTIRCNNCNTLLYNSGPLEVPTHRPAL